MKKKLLKYAGVLITIAGFGITFLEDWHQEKTMEELVDEKIQKALKGDKDDEK